MTTRDATRSMIGTLVLAVVVGAVAEAPAHAYIDPSSGTLVAQVIIGSALGAYTIAKLYLKSMIARVRALFKPRRPR